jgi:AcrR family transcriptional regulator
MSFDVITVARMTPGVIEYAVEAMRWQPDAQGRLQKAALALYAERGFEHTTVAQIAEHAGLTKRTFFRYFADKREVLFLGAAQLQELFVGEVLAASESATPLQAVSLALDAVAEMFEQRREGAAQRQQIILANPELQERELIKLASLAAAVAEALRERGVEDSAAILTAEAGITVFRLAFQRWVEQRDGQDLKQLMREALEQLRAIAVA